MSRLVPLLPAAAAAASIVCAATAQAQQRFELKKGDHIAILGGGVADRMQHDGWLETLITAAHPDLDLVFRNLAVAGDEVGTWHRSENFGTRDEWLGKTGADVIFAFYGFNESFRGYEGVKAFQEQLDRFLKETKSGNYSGRGEPRIVLFSPVAAERHPDGNFPDPAAINSNLHLYTAAMAETAAANGVVFVNLLEPSLAVLEDAARKGTAMTVNGIHWTADGNAALAPRAFEALFGRPAPAGDFEKLRLAILDRNWQWHQRYRTMDGYNVYGGRSRLSYEGQLPDGRKHDKISNYEVMQREMSQRDVLTANRDARVHAVAKGGDLEVKDDNLPEPISVGTNLPGDREDLSHTFPSGEEMISRMKVHRGMKVNLFADEKQFPELVNPVQMAWDARGRLWVSVWPNYPERQPASTMGDALLIFEDTDSDGRADKVTKFLDDLNCPTGFQFFRDGVLVMQAPDLWFVRDTDGDGRADTRERLVMGIDSADSHHTTNAMCYDSTGAVLMSDGVFHRTQVETATGPVRNADGCIYRFEPVTGKFERYIPYGFANPHGRVVDEWGNDLITDATGNENYFGPAFSGYLDEPHKHPTMRQFWNRPSRPCPGTGILSSRHFPDEFQGNFLNANVISFHGIYRVGMSQDGSGLRGETLEDIVSSTEPTFRPSCMANGPDGALYFCDWANAIIGHMQHHLRDPNRDHQHGRIYRIAYEGRPLLTPPRIHDEPVEKLLDLLKVPELDTRTLVKIELQKHDGAAVAAAAKRWAAGLDRSDPRYEHHRLEALWVHSWVNVVDGEMLREVLSSPEPRARAAAVRVLSYWRDRVQDVNGLLRTAAGDEDPRVRLQAVRAASFLRSSEGADIALACLTKPTDYWLEYTLRETLRQLEPWWREAIAAGKAVAEGNPAGIAYLLGSLSPAELLKMPRIPQVLEAVATAPGIAEADRFGALVDLAAARNRPLTTEVVSLLEADSAGPAAADLARILPRQAPSDLKAAVPSLEKIAATARDSAVRAFARAASLTAAGSLDAAWEAATASGSGLIALLEAIPYIGDPALRATIHGRLMSLLGEPSPDLAEKLRKAPSGAQFVRIELPRRGTLTLAEVEVISGGTNIARSGKATQSSTAYDGDASRAIDGNANGGWSAGGQTHTRENEENPWWELDLGSEHPVEAVRIWNRTDDRLGRRLNGFTLTLLDSGRNEVDRRTRLPAPEPSLTVEVNAAAGNPLAAIRRAAMAAAVSTGEDPAGVFDAIGRIIASGESVPAAARAIRSIPPALRPASAAPVARSLVAWAEKLPAEERTKPDCLTVVQTADELARSLPPAEGAEILRRLRDVRVPVFLVSAVPEQLRFDTTRIVVEAGKPFEIIVTNPDVMPHNLIVTEPGGAQKLGLAAMSMLPDQLDGSGRAYVPQGAATILAATKLLERGQSETLKLTAPGTEGEYEFVCTFPGHWTVMQGKIVVTRDPDAAGGDGGR